AGHILGVALLLGAILPLDLRLLGLWPSVPVAHLARVLVPMAAMGLALALVSGGLLFSVDPRQYAALNLFRFKLLVILAGGLNLLLVHRNRAWRAAITSPTPTVPDRRLQLGGLLSACLWLTALLCGRLLGYS
ncbi:MAG: hypothetical protein R3310_12680, partial [Candidatus Competibacteraceae bacterium]|nr:hypothetical protein [Candidatus Competibacteraceae bacterium]